MQLEMNEGVASIVRTAIKCVAVVIVLNGWPQLRKPNNTFNQTVLPPKTEFDDLSEGDWVHIDAHGHTVFSQDEWDVNARPKSEVDDVVGAPR